MSVKKGSVLLGGGLTAGAVCFAMIIANRDDGELAKVPLGESSQPVVSEPTLSDRSIDPGEAPGHSSRPENRPADIPSTPPPVSVQEEVKDRIAQVGPQAAVEQYRDDFSLLPAARTARVEAATRQWSREDPHAAWGWIETQRADDKAEGEVVQAAMSGYIESVALIDPEAAANASELLDQPGDEASKPRPVRTTSKVFQDPGRPRESDYIIRNRR